jgi:hypothetical protein
MAVKLVVMEKEEKKIPLVIVGGKPYDPNEEQMDRVLSVLARAKANREKREAEQPVEIIGGKPYDRDEVEHDYFEQGLAEGLAARAKRKKADTDKRGA